MSQGLTPQSFSAHSGEVVSIPVTVLDSAGVAVDVSGTTVKFAMARRPGGTAVVSSQSPLSNATTTIVSGPAGTIRADMTAAVTEALHGTYYWEMRVDDVVVAYGYFDFLANLIPA